ncbi:MAG: GNAT family N-acetyltransferase [Anaerolineae bacterium]|nr:GNAT family N-acetyltransferase [Anaerolineae bacterium]
MMQDSEIVRLEAARRGRAGGVLAQAFRDDPAYIVAMPRADKRADVLAWLFDRVVYYSLLYGEVYITSSLEGVVCWLPPGQTHVTLWRVVRSGLHATPLRMGLAAYRRFDAYMGYADAFHARYAPESHWYLWAIGVAPASQGKGIGSRLMQPILKRADADGKACYLETGTEGNARFYEKHGFKVVGGGKVPKLGIQVLAMVREPANA